MKACVWDGAGRFVLEDVAEPTESPGWVALDVIRVGICGTDLHLRRGHHARAVAGAVPGHELLGRLRRSVGDLERGARVFADPFISCGRCTACRIHSTPQLCGSLRLIGADFRGGLAERVVVPEAGLAAIPESMSDTAAALVEPVAVVARAVRRARIVPGQSVLVVGGGPIGYLVASLARRSGAARVVLAEPAQARRQHAAEHGISTIADAADAEPADVVFDASGHPSVTAQLGRLVNTGGVAVLVATQSREASIDLSRLPFGEISLIGSGGYAAVDIERAIALLTTDFAADAVGVVTATVGLSEVSHALDRMEAGSELKVLVSPAKVPDAGEFR